MNMVKLQNTKLIYKNLLHFYTVTVTLREIKKTIPFVIALKRNKNLGINLPKVVKSCTHKAMLMKETEDDTN